MPIGTSIAIYFIIWWLVLFAVLPFGVRSQQEAGSVAPGTEPGAPARPLLWRKLLATTKPVTPPPPPAIATLQQRLSATDAAAQPQHDGDPGPVSLVFHHMHLFTFHLPENAPAAVSSTELLETQGQFLGVTQRAQV